MKIRSNAGRTCAANVDVNHGEANTPALTNQRRRRFALFFSIFLSGLAACGSDTQQGAAAVLCSPGQAGGCRCPDGSAPSATGCNAAPGSTAGGTAPGAGASASS